MVRRHTSGFSSPSLQRWKREVPPEGFLHGTIPQVRPDHPCDEVGDSGAERRNSGAEGRKNTLRERIGPATVRAAEPAMERGKHCKIPPPD